MATTRRTPPVVRDKPIATVTPNGFAPSGVSKRMTVEKDVVDELLLVCGVIGSTTKDPSNDDQLVPVTDCLNWLQDLQRALRRDDDSYRPISLLLGKWKVVQQKLLPLVMSCRYDTPMVLTIVKILVILTKPLSDNAKRAGRMVIDAKSRKFPESVVKEQIKLRENALAQSEMLMEYKRAVAHHPSHLASLKGKEKGQGGLLSVFVSLLAEPLSKTGTSRTDSDHLTIELVLHLFRNLLSAEPLLKDSSDTSHRSSRLHQELVVLFERELVLEIVLVIAQEMELRENAQYNLLMMELLHHLLRNQDPTSVARSVIEDRSAKSLIGKENHSCQLDAKRPKGDGAKKHSNTGELSHGSLCKGSGSLRAQLNREKQRFSGIGKTRHSHFGGTLVVKRAGGKRQYRSAVLGDKQVDPPVAKKRKNRKTEPFIGAGKSLAAHTSCNVSVAEDGPTALRAKRSLHNFCCRFIKDCYGPVMKSLKNEFRRDSVRLEEGDKVVFFRIVWFFCQWWRFSGAGQETAAQDDGADVSDDTHHALGQMIFTMDVFTFNLVLNATDTFHLHKKHAQLAQTVALYSEMMCMLLAMYRSPDSTENLMALGLLDRLFYGNEPLDRLPKLLSKWTPGSSTREYACDLVELCHVSLKLLEVNSEACANNAEETGKAADVDKKKKDAVSRMRETASEFDLSSYVLRRIVSNQLVFMYTHLLSQYAINSPNINRHVIEFLERLPKITIVSNEDGDDYDEAGLSKNLLASKTVTLEPMLYHIQTITVLDQILNDTSIRNNNDFETLLSFASTIMSNFVSAAGSNPLLFVECLFRHPIPHRFCELSTNMYVNEELRMIAEREMLLDERTRFESEPLDQQDENASGGPTGMRATHLGSTGKDPRPLPSSTAEEETEWVDEVSHETAQATKNCSHDGVKETSDDNTDGETDSKHNQSVQKGKAQSNESASDDESDIVVPDTVVENADSIEHLTEKSHQSNEKLDSEASNSDPKEEIKKKSRLGKAATDDASDDDDDLFDDHGAKESVSDANAARTFLLDDDDD